MSLHSRLFFRPEIEIDAWEFFELIGQMDEGFFDSLADEYEDASWGGERCSLEHLQDLIKCLNGIVQAQENKEEEENDR